MEIREISDYEVMLALEIFNREFYKRTLGNNVELQEKFVEERKTKNKEILQQYIDGEVKIFGLYLDGDVFAGSVMLENDKIRHLVVRKYWQGMGYGSELLQFVSNYAKEQGVKVLKVEAVGKNIPLYEKNGFKVVSDLDMTRYPHVNLEKEL